MFQRLEKKKKKKLGCEKLTVCGVENVHDVKSLKVSNILCSYLKNCNKELEMNETVLC